VHDLTAYVGTYGLAFVFVNVFLLQVGLPIPAIPTLAVAGALAAQGDLSAPLALGVAVVASLVADSIWFWLGHRHGHRVLSTLCRISLNPDSCVRQTESIFGRWGPWSLVFAKFVPGFSTVAPPVAGAMRASVAAFLVYDGAGALLWAGVGIGAGMIFHGAIDRVLELLEDLGIWALGAIGGALGLFIALKGWQRRRFFRLLRMARLSPREVRRLIDEGQRPLILDVRTEAGRKLDPRRIPGAVALDLEDLDARIDTLPRDREIVLYCS
jgi:membrane protein DedA with SNARE-associated domain